MTCEETLWIAVIATALLVTCITVVWLAADETAEGAANAAATLALVGFTAVAIERVIETGWTIFGSLVGTYWPLKKVSQQVDALVTQVNDALKPLQDDVRKAVSGVAAAANAGLTELSAQLGTLAGQQGSNQNARAISRTAKSYVEQAQLVLTTHTPAIELAQLAIRSLDSFVDSLTDNPGRRLISLYLGVMLGIVVAYAFDLNLFHAALAGGAANSKYADVEFLILTGVVIGLGSNPTHEVIRAIQEYKKGQKAAQGQPA